MHNIDLILTLTGCLATALALGFLTQRLGLSPIVGYLLGGILVGPHTPGFVANREIAEQLAEIGIILLMFGVGLKFRIRELMAVRRVALPGALIQSLFTTLLGFLAARASGVGWSGALVFGFAVSVASTVVMTRVLADHKDLHTTAGHIAIGWLVVEDVFTVVLLVLLPALFGPSKATAGPLWLILSVTLIKVALLLLFTFVVGDRVIPWLFGRIALTRSRELFTLSVLVVALGIAVGSAKVFGVSMALGAFLAGMVVGRSEFSARAGSDALPMRDAFAVLFFVSVGMLLDPWHITEAPGSVLLVTAIIMVGKPLIAMLVVIISRYPLQTAATVAVALAQIGEFSFILAARAEYFGLFSRAVSNTLITAAIVSITLNPLYYRLAQLLSGAVATRRRRRLDEYGQSLDESGPERTEENPYEHRAIVIGSGPVGQIITRILRDNRIEPVVVELNIRRVRQLRKEGVSVVYGDAADELVMQAAGIEKAVSLMISPGGMNGVERVIRLARRLNPQIRVFARTEFLSDASELLRAGALRVFSDEGEVALAFGEELLRELGASADQIDRERDRVHEELIAMQIDDDSDSVSDGKMPVGDNDSGGAV